MTTPDLVRVRASRDPALRLRDIDAVPAIQRRLDVGTRSRSIILLRETMRKLENAQLSAPGIFPQVSLHDKHKMRQEQ